jgi:hypothetical protein
MRVSLSLLLLLLALLSGTGCAGLTLPGTAPTVGWSFYIGRPSAVMTASPAILSESQRVPSVQTMGNLNGTSPSILHTAPPNMQPIYERQKAQLYALPATTPNPCPPCPQPCAPCAPQE